MKHISNKLERIINFAYQQNIASSISLSFTCGKNYTQEYATNSNIIYDLASLTKIIGTTLAVAKTIVDGKIELDSKPFPTWPHTSIRSLLEHTSGLPAHKKFYEDLLLTYNFKHNAELIYNSLFTLKPLSQKNSVYSDLGFIALGFLLEKIWQKPLHKIFCDVWAELEIQTSLLYCPSQPVPYLAENNLFAPTGLCPIRKKIIKGELHDLNGFFMGGLAGHAGLFGTIKDVSLIGQFFLRANKKPNTPLEELIKYFSQNYLGFRKPERLGSTSSFSSTAFGHFGFTGVALWMDPRGAWSKGLSIALLTNRVHTDKNPEGIFWLRKKIFNLINENI